MSRAAGGGPSGTRPESLEGRVRSLLGLCSVLVILSASHTPVVIPSQSGSLCMLTSQPPHRLATGLSASPTPFVSFLTGTPQEGWCSCLGCPFLLLPHITFIQEEGAGIESWLPFPPCAPPWLPVPWQLRFSHAAPLGSSALPCSLSLLA